MQAIKAGRLDGRRGAIRQPQLRRPRASGGARRFPRLAAAGGGVCARRERARSISTSEPLGDDAQGQPVYLRDLWPERGEIDRVIAQTIDPALYRERYAEIGEGSPQWRALATGTGTTFRVERAQHVHPPAAVLRGHARRARASRATSAARACSRMFGDMFTTDHISPIGAIAAGTPAARISRARSASRRATSSTTRRGASITT